MNVDFTKEELELIVDMVENDIFGDIPEAYTIFYKVMDVLYPS